VPAGLIDQEDGVGIGCDSFGDFRQVQVHGLGVAGQQDQGGAPALVWADRAEDVGGSGALVARRDGTGTALGPPSRDLVLLANARFVGEPDFYRLAVERFLVRLSPDAWGNFFKILNRALGRAGDPAYLVAACERAHSTLGWQPRFDDLQTIVTHALAWERKLQRLLAASEYAGSA
jgi:hypothetical protein